MEKINNQKGFVIPIIIAVIAILAIGGGVFVYTKTKVEAPVLVGPNLLDQIATTTQIVATTTDPVITSISPNSGPIGTVVEIKGDNLNGFEGDMDAWIQSGKGEVGELGFLHGIDSHYDYQKNTDQVIRVKIENLLCVTGSIYYSGLPCTSYTKIIPGVYYIYVSPWGRKSNYVEFTVTNSVDTVKKYFSSPEKNASFGFGDTINIKWDPSAIDASTIYLSCVDSTECYGDSYQIYKRQNLNDPVSIVGSFSYQVPNSYTGPNPGHYKVVVYSYGLKNNIKSEEFKIIPPVETAPKTNNSHYIQSITGQKNEYNAGEKITLFVDARDYNAVPASPDRGFNIQAHIFDANNYPGPSFQAVNASYNSTDNLWRIDMNAPNDKSLIYNLQISLYCGYIGLGASSGLSSVCAQEHGTSNSQQDKTISFLVK